MLYKIKPWQYFRENLAEKYVVTEKYFLLSLKQGYNRLKSHYTANDSTSFLLRNIITRCDKKRCRTTVK